MKLSDAEQKLVAKLRKQQRDFIRLRWFRLIISGLSTGVGIYGLLALYRSSRSDSLFAVLATFIVPVAYFFLVLGAWLGADTLMNWHGRAEVDLLLRLIED